MVPESQTLVPRGQYGANANEKANGGSDTVV
jgi:hypothetical protein